MEAEPTTPVEDYIYAAAPPGTIDHFVLLFAPDTVRELVSVGMALGKVILNIPKQDTEVQIRQLKLHWWLEEIQRCEQNEPRHPLTKRLAETGATTGWSPHLDTLVRDALDDVGQTPLIDLQSVLTHAHHLGGRQALLAALHPNCSETDLKNAHAGGVGIALTELLATPGSRLDLNQLSPGDPSRTPAEELASVAHSHFESMTRPEAPGQQSILLQSQLYRHKLHRMARNGYSDGADPHPLKLLWQAWRQARKLRT